MVAILATVTVEAAAAAIHKLASIMERVETDTMLEPFLGLITAIL